MDAVKIAMRKNAYSSNSPKDIVGLFIESEFGDIKEFDINRLYDMLFENSDMKIYVKNTSSYLIPSRATNGQKYIRSMPNLSMIDELMRLPRCKTK